MTTIACDGKMVAADGQMTAGNEVISRGQVKIATWAASKVLGFTGARALQDVIFEWYKNGADPHKIDGVLKEQEWTLAVFGKGGCEYYRNNCPYVIDAPYPIAFGSGQDFAVGAMLHGASAREAIQIACQKDIMTSGKITVLEIPDTEADLAATRLASRIAVA